MMWLAMWQFTSCAQTSQKKADYEYKENSCGVLFPGGREL